MAFKATQQEVDALIGKRSGQAASKPGRKYRNTRVQVDGQWFDSQFEAHHYEALKVRQRAGEIRSLECQVTYPCVVNGRVVCMYVADFVYQERRGKEWFEVRCDTKSPITRKTPAYRIKAKLMAALGNPVTEVVKEGWKAR